MTPQEQSEINEKINTLATIVDKLKKNPPLPDHYHNGIDSSKIEWGNLNTRKIYLTWAVSGTNAATAANYGVFFIAPFTCYVSAVKEVHGTAGTDAGAVSLTLEKLTGTTALDSGVAVLSSVLSLKATANTVQTGTLTTTLANRNLAIGDRLALKDAGTLTNVADVVVTVELTLP